MTIEMRPVGISVSPCEDAARIGYDARQINRLVIRMSQLLLDKGLRLVFGHDWREDGVMRAVAGFAEKVAAGRDRGETQVEDRIGRVNLASADLRVVNVVPTSGRPISPVALKAVRESRGVLGVVDVPTVMRHLEASERPEASRYRKELKQVVAGNYGEDARGTELACLRMCVAWLLHKGFRICLAGQRERGRTWGVQEEAVLSEKFGRPVYVLGGYGGAARSFGEKEGYRQIENGLDPEAKDELFNTTDIERAVEIVLRGMSCWGEHHADSR